MKPPTPAKTENLPSEDAPPPSKPATMDKFPEDDPLKPKPRVGVPQTRLDDEVALRADEIMASVVHKSRRRKPKSKRGLGKPTGFEEYYADGPMTPAEHEKSRRIYDPYVHFLAKLPSRLTNYSFARSYPFEQ
jgi:hypothetical protein